MFCLLTSYIGFSRRRERNETVYAVFVRVLPRKTNAICGYLPRLSFTVMYCLYIHNYVNVHILMFLVVCFEWYVHGNKFELELELVYCSLSSNCASIRPFLSTRCIPTSTEPYPMPIEFTHISYSVYTRLRPELES